MTTAATTKATAAAGANMNLNKPRKIPPRKIPSRMKKIITASNDDSDINELLSTSLSEIFPSDRALDEFTDHTASTDLLDDLDNTERSESTDFHSGDFHSGDFHSGDGNNNYNKHDDGLDKSRRMIRFDDGPGGSVNDDEGLIMRQMVSFENHEPQKRRFNDDDEEISLDVRDLFPELQEEVKTREREREQRAEGKEAQPPLPQQKKAPRILQDLSGISMKALVAVATTNSRPSPDAAVYGNCDSDNDNSESILHRNCYDRKKHHRRSRNVLRALFFAPAHMCSKRQRRHSAERSVAEGDRRRRGNGGRPAGKQGLRAQIRSGISGRRNGGGNHRRAGTVGFARHPTVRAFDPSSPAMDVSLPLYEDDHDYLYLDDDNGNTRNQTPGENPDAWYYTTGSSWYNDDEYYSMKKEVVTTMEKIVACRKLGTDFEDNDYQTARGLEAVTREMILARKNYKVKSRLVVYDEQEDQRCGGGASDAEQIREVYREATRHALDTALEFGRRDEEAVRLMLSEDRWGKTVIPQ
eukprot:CAMPEP_0201230460 /NCGR_PEP_ID=MMETSP0852-20130820/1841_1 /ASSEMBLY_ACC=CAM_ASM_000632 /TAXON_ID=183588 /ORGANISM="Pseudo-nitzschia fraudulenta, Strain WWA7" /LENGTH=524 /DNA_ID=CAMNT_0047521261 /DNA_START=305 /DNA_END=1879 /DNA_ORIENTATION=-